MQILIRMVCVLVAWAAFDARGETTAWAARTVMDRHGYALNLEGTLQAGRYVVFVFWQSWCGSCRKEAPGLVEAARRFAGHAQFVGVVSGPDKAIDEDKVDRFIRETGITYPQVRDRDLSLTRDFDVKATPTIVVVAPDGRIVYYDHRAPAEWSHVLKS